VIQGVGPEFKPQYWEKKKQKPKWKVKVTPLREAQAPAEQKGPVLCFHLAFRRFGCGDRLEPRVLCKLHRVTGSFASHSHVIELIPDCAMSLPRIYCYN
jgi:hypothetical protein